MFEVLSILSKGTRVSRKVTAGTVAEAGLWGALTSTGGIGNVATGVTPVYPKMMYNTISSNQYESHDTQDRIATLEGVGIRIQVGSTLYAGSPEPGQNLVVGFAAGREGKIVPIDSVADGTHVVVAECETYDATNHILVYKTVSPRSVTIAGNTTTTTPVPTTTTVAPTTTAGP